MFYVQVIILQVLTYSKQKYKQKLTERKRGFFNNGKNNLLASLS